MSGDTGERLRSLFADQGGTRAIFSRKVCDYAASRPDYPSALFAALPSWAGLARDAQVVDVGAGTGLFTHGLLATGWRVVAVEPNADMRAAADAALAGFSGYRSADGAAERLPLADASADLIAAAQAFHWFDIGYARAEFLRVLRPQRNVLLVWNDRVLDDPLHVALDHLFARHGGAKRGALLAHEERHDVPRFFGSAAYETLSWPHEHRLDEAGLASLVFSRSYMPARDTAEGRVAGDEVQAVFRRFAREHAVVVRYTTVAMLGRPNAGGPA